LNDVIENQNLQEETLNQRIPDQINPKAIPKKGIAFGIWIFSLEKNKYSYKRN
jgi:hypothetical protein